MIIVEATDPLPARTLGAELDEACTPRRFIRFIRLAVAGPAPADNDVDNAGFRLRR